jgi:hypothetical protein
VDDKWRLWTGRSGAHEWRTADPLASPGSPVESCGFGQQYVVLLRRTTSAVACENGEVGNPGSLGMTKRRGPLHGKSGCWMKGQLLSLDLRYSNLLKRISGLDPHAREYVFLNEAIVPR